MSAQEPGTVPEDVGLSSWSPLRYPLYRRLWTAWLAACLVMWTNDVACAWLMTSLTTSPVMIALVQTAATLPIFILGLPSGALADIVDRRRLLILTQVWAFVVASTLFAVTAFGALQPLLLLALVFANGLVLAVRWPAFSASIPDLVPVREIPGASALSGVANNTSRITGPLIAGAIIAALGPAHVFAFNALLSVVSAVLLISWSYVKKPTDIPSERMWSAIRVGLQHARQTPAFRHVAIRVAAFFFNTIALIALLPLVAKQLGGQGAGMFTLLLAAMGVGGVTAAFAMPKASLHVPPQRRLVAATLLFSIASLIVSVSTHAWLTVLAAFAAGGGWVMGANTLMVSAMLALPGWVRARGLSMIQMTMMGSTATGAAVWGYVASLTSVRIGVAMSAVATIVALLLTRKATLVVTNPEELTPAGSWTPPEIAAPIGPDEGPVLVLIEYRIDPSRTEEFFEIMRESRRMWLAHGLSEWSLFSDVADIGRHVEHMVDESWAAYLRRNERIAVSYLPLRERKRAIHLGPGIPVVTRYVGAFGRDRPPAVTPASSPPVETLPS